MRSRCDGVPFYIEHVVAGLEMAGQERQVPEALYEPLFARLHTRADVVPVVEAAAVIGRTWRSRPAAIGRRRAKPTSMPSSTELVQARVFESQWFRQLAIPP